MNPGLRRLAFVALFLAFTLAALAPVRSYDSFWQLATGRWIADNGALPEKDPFSIASDDTRWINGQWLFQVALYGIHKAGGFVAMSWARAAFVGAIFFLSFASAARKRSWHLPLIAASAGFAGSATFLDVRPATAAAFLVVASIALLDHIHDLPRDAERTFAIAGYALLSIVWINTHPSALLAPIFAAAAFSGVALPVASALALLVNPHGVEGVTAPLRLMSFVNSGEFVNSEWLPSSPFVFPLLYVAILSVVVLFARGAEKKRELWRMVIFAGLAYLAVRHVRNQPLFFAALPLLVAPFSIPRLPRFAAPSIAALAIAFVAVTTPHAPGIDASGFPVSATARVLASGFKGNVYNPDQFGGFLIWNFYPERRVLTDGRNELYRAYISEYAAARGDSRKWNALLRKYRIDLAVDEYRAPLPVVNARTGETTYMPASLAYFPRREWALIGYDRVGMAFARRAAFPADDLERVEIKGIVPDRIER